MPEFILQHWELTRAPQLAAVEFCICSRTRSNHQVRVGDQSQDRQDTGTRERIAGTPHSAAKRIGAIKKNLRDGDMDIRAPDQQTW